MKHILSIDNFSIIFELEIFENDLEYPINTTLHITVHSCGFSGNASMDIGIKEFAKFCYKLSMLYDSLKGNAKIQEPYGYQQYIEFQADKLGHILVNGIIRSGSEFTHELKFENVIDQTILYKLQKELNEAYSKYL